MLFSSLLVAYSILLLISNKTVQELSPQLIFYQIMCLFKSIYVVKQVLVLILAYVNQIYQGLYHGEQGYCDLTRFCIIVLITSSVSIGLSSYLDLKSGLFSNRL